MYCSHSCRQFAYVLRKSKESVKDFSLEKVPNEINDLSVRTEEEIPINAEINLPVRTEEEIPVNTGIELAVRTEEEIPVNTEIQFAVRTDEQEQQKTMLPIAAENKAEINKEDYADYPSRYLIQLNRLYEERDLWHSLSKFFDSNDEAGLWVSERYRCLIEVLLTFTEMKRIELDDLKEVCNAFTDVINSKHYKCLDPNYPYTDEIKSLREQIKNICIKTIGEHFKYRISPEQKQGLIVTRFELSQWVKKRKFSELKFKEK